MKQASAVSTDAQNLITFIIENTEPELQKEIAEALVELTDIFVNVGGSVVVWALQRNGIIKPEQVKLIEQLVFEMLNEGEQEAEGTLNVGGKKGLVH